MEPATGYPVPPNEQRPNGYPAAPPGTGYPFQAAVQPSNSYYYNPQNPSSYTAARPTLYRRLILLFIIVTSIFFTGLFISWIVIRPRVPVFHITSFTMSTFNSSSHQLSGTWAARFEVFNPNKKMDIEYDQIQAFISFKEQSLAQNRLQPFVQQHKNHTVLETDFSIINTFVDQWVSDAADEDKKDGSVTFDLKVVADVGFRVGELRARRRQLQVSCSDLTVTLSGSGGSGNLTKGHRQCYVRT
ncbi:NDR1/HIN1-like protein 10 [Linum grandiflorum]